MEIDRAGKFDVERAKAANIPLCCWNPLQKGNVVEFEGVHYTPDMVLGEARKGIKLTYTTDTRPTRSIIQSGSRSVRVMADTLQSVTGTSGRIYGWRA